MACRAPISGTKQSYLSYLSSWVIYHHLSIIYPLYPPKKSSFSCQPLDPRPRMAAAAGFRRVAVLDPRH